MHLWPLPPKKISHYRDRCNRSAAHLLPKGAGASCACGTIVLVGRTVIKLGNLCPINQVAGLTWVVCTPVLACCLSRYKFQHKPQGSCLSFCSPKTYRRPPAYPHWGPTEQFSTYRAKASRDIQAEPRKTAVQLVVTHAGALLAIPAALQHDVPWTPQGGHARLSQTTRGRQAVQCHTMRTLRAQRQAPC